MTTCFAVAAVAAALAPSPARAAATCQTLLQSTPGAKVDLDGDGYPEASVPRILDVTLCSDAGASYVTHEPRLERCFIGWHPKCIAVYVTVVPASAQAGARADLCYTIEGQTRTCRVVTTPPQPAPIQQTVCIGFDLDGGHPCTGGTVFSFE